MGEHAVQGARDERSMRAFTRALLEDLRALDRMLERGMIESGPTRVGVEQEMFLVDEAGRPAPQALSVLEALGDPRFTTEIALYNLEGNLPPRPLDGAFLRVMEEDLEDLRRTAMKAASKVGVRVLFTGILPTLDKSHITQSNLTPQLRYIEMNSAISAQRGEAHPIAIHGVDELEVMVDSVVLESANTSLQLHLQVDPRAFARLYNLAQLISAPLLAAAVNSPLLLGRRLWHETRIALFERLIDARSDAERERGAPPRVRFGDGWVHDSVLELFREDAARSRILLTREAEADPVGMVERGEIPRLYALTLHNGTTWRWNRPCYGVADGRAHLRIENRVLPSGPTVLDEVANAALFYGMMLELDSAYGDVSKRLSFEKVRENFVEAARRGLDAHFSWFDGAHRDARELLLSELLPAARQGLSRVGTPGDDIRRYLGVIEERVRSGQTGARWTLESFERLRREMTPKAASAALTAAMLRAEEDGEPVHRWPLCEPPQPDEKAVAAQRVREIMSTDLFTVRPNDVVDLAASVMSWKHVRHVPVEGEHGELLGLVSHRALLRLFESQPTEPVPVSSIMDAAPATVDPEATVAVAMRLLLEGDAGCLLVVSEGRLEGIVTERDFLRVMAKLFAPQSTLP